MPKYSDSKVQVQENKLTYFHGGFGVQPVYELLVKDTHKVGYQKRFFLERLLTYKAIIKGDEVPILFTEGFFNAGILYYLFKATPKESAVFIHSSYKPLFASVLCEDLVKSRNIVWYENVGGVLAKHLSSVPCVYILMQLNAKTDLRSFLDFISTRRGSLLMVLDYASNADKNERLYAQKYAVKLLEHIDESADFFS